jgi:hypothetical protein
MTTSVNISDGNPHTLRLAMSPTGAVLLVDGAVAATSAVTPATAGVVTGGFFDVRHLNAGFGWPNGWVDEVAVWSSYQPDPYTPALIGNNAPGLVSVWHLDGNLLDSAGSAPTISAQPSGATVTAGATATFSVTASGGTTPYTYQWRRNGIAISGATASAYTTPATTLSGGTANNGDVYSVVVTDAGAASVTSSGATLTVTSNAATAITLTGPSTGPAGAASSNFTAAANGVITGTVPVTPSDSGAGGTFTPASLSISSGTPTATFSYTASSAGAKTISVSNGGGLSNPASLTYTATAPALYVRVDATEALTGQPIMVLVPSGASALPYNAANPTRVVIYCHGHGEDQTALLSDPIKSACVNALLNAGFILAGCNAFGSTWGNQAVADSYAGLARYLRANYNVHPAGVAVWSMSMGGLPGTAMVVQRKAGPIVGWLGTYPVCNLANLYSLGTYTGVINAAFGIGAGDATYANKTVGMDPVLRAASDYRDTPVRIYSSRSDTVVPGEQNGELLATLLAGSRIEATHVSCTGNHGDPSHLVPAEYVAFIDRCYSYATRSTRTVAVTITTDGTTPRASETGLKWSVRECSVPGGVYGPVIAHGSNGAITGGAGLFSVSVSTYIAPGSTVWLDVTSSDGTTTQSPMGWQWSGPLVVT